MNDKTKEPCRQHQQAHDDDKNLLHHQLFHLPVFAFVPHGDPPLIPRSSFIEGGYAKVSHAA
jgi:hypothetical protein